MMVVFNLKILTNSTGVLVVAGPKARELMKRVSRDDFSNENFKWLSAKNVDVGCTSKRYESKLCWRIRLGTSSSN